jgi:hypothetical protein
MGIDSKKYFEASERITKGIKNNLIVEEIFKR